VENLENVSIHASPFSDIIEPFFPTPSVHQQWSSIDFEQH
jgi:hypothetical protein